MEEMLNLKENDMGMEHLQNIGLPLSLFQLPGRRRVGLRAFDDWLDFPCDQGMFVGISQSFSFYVVIWTRDLEMTGSLKAAMKRQRDFRCCHCNTLINKAMQQNGIIFRKKSTASEQFL